MHACSELKASSKKRLKSRSGRTGLQSNKNPGGKRERVSISSGKVERGEHGIKNMGGCN